ncbi:hypothetical protein IC582_002061 [Cucumis melo]
MIHESELVCRQNTWIDKRTFAILCHLLRNVAGLSSTEIVDVEEIIAMFLHVLSHEKLVYVFGRDRATGRFAETFADMAFNEPGGYEGFDMSDGNEEFPPMYSQRIDMS